MLFVIRCLDKPDQAPVRAETRPRHLAYIDAHASQVRFAGPMLSDDETPIGSIFVMAFEGRADAERYIAADPYVLAGIFGTVEITRTRQVVPAETAP